jgi:rod shape determining protein RodA
MFKFRDYHIRYFNLRLLLYVGLLCYAGTQFVGSATALTADSAATMTKQLFGIGIGIAAMLFVSIVDYHFLLKCAIPIYCACLGLLLAVRLFGATYNNAQRWIEIGSLSLQPAEFCKIGLIVFFAAFFANRKQKGKINSPLWVVVSVLFLALPAFLIFKQPDLSTTLVVITTFLFIIFSAGISYKWVFGVMGAAVPVGVWFLYEVQQPNQTLINGYQLERVMSWLHPEQFVQQVYQSSNSVMAIGNGGLNGRGLFNTTLESVKNGNFLVEQDTDFIFAVVGEEVGFIGSCVIIGLLMLVVAECIYLAIRAKDLGGRLICVGYASLIAFQAFVNIGVATSLLPNTGIPLPFISAGLSSLLSLFLGLGLVLNVGLQRENEKTI